MNPRFLAGSIPVLALLLALFNNNAHAEQTEQTGPTKDAKELDPVQVTATRFEEPVDSVPASITVVTDEQMRAHGARDLRGALALVAGVEISPGGDGGPAGSVPAFWGLREFDAFLLVVDDVPYGGAFNPQLTTLDLTNVERIEVMRGAAPVMYGATSFVGIIHVIHYPPGHTPRRVAANYGSYGSAGASLSMDIGDGPAAQSFTLDGERVNLSDDAANYGRGHLLYRLNTQMAQGNFSLDLDGTITHQDPNSPSPRAGPVLDPIVPIDANHNPADAKLDENRFQLSARYQRPVALGEWATTVSYTYTDGSYVRGFLVEDYADAPPTNAVGFRQERQLDDLYFDSHLVNKPSANLTMTYGVDWLYGRANYANEIFDYSVGLDGSGRPPSGSQPVLDEPAGSDTRDFFGLYTQADWAVSDRVDILAGLRLNHTEETHVGDKEVNGIPEPATEQLNKTRFSGTIGASVHLWNEGANALTLYGDVRNTYKPAAIDFGPEAEAEILSPETALSYEMGLKGQFLDGTLDWDFSAFYMNFDNLVVSQSVDGLPGLVNAGSEIFKGAEFEINYLIGTDLRLTGTFAYHDARFSDYEQLFGNTLTQLDGKRLEMSPQYLGGFGVLYSPAHGWQAAVIANYTGDRYLNKRNTALAGSYTTLEASLGYRFDRCELRINGTNLTDRRDPVAESELGEGQYYRLPARVVELSVNYSF